MTLSNFLPESLRLLSIMIAGLTFMLVKIFKAIAPTLPAPNKIMPSYLNVSNFFLETKQQKYLNAILDKLSKIIRNGWIYIN